MNTIIFVTGNISNGKTTLIENINNSKGNNYVCIKEPVHLWKDHFDKIKESPTKDNFLNLHKSTCLFLIESITLALSDKSKILIIERDPIEHIVCFYSKTFSSFWNKEEENLNKEILDLYYGYITALKSLLDNDFKVKIIALPKISNEEIIRRTNIRNQTNDDSLDPDYLTNLEERYNILYKILNNETFKESALEEKEFNDLKLFFNEIHPQYRDSSID